MTALFVLADLTEPGLIVLVVVVGVGALLGVVALSKIVRGRSSRR